MSTCLGYFCLCIQYTWYTYIHISRYLETFVHSIFFLFLQSLKHSRKLDNIYFVMCLHVKLFSLYQKKSLNKYNGLKRTKHYINPYLHREHLKLTTNVLAIVCVSFFCSYTGSLSVRFVFIFVLNSFSMLLLVIYMCMVYHLLLN